MNARDERPSLVRVISGDPTHEELAALVAVLATVNRESGGRGGAARDARAVSAWTERLALMRRAAPPGPGVWRFSATPS